MSDRNEIPPDGVLAALRQNSTRQQKIDNLNRLHDICAAQHANGGDFSISSIGRLWEVAGGIKARALYNAASLDYRTLIKTWEAWSGPSTQRKAQHPQEKGSLAYLSRIDDPAIRQLVQAAVNERDKLKAEMNLLKSKTVLEINRRPPAIAGTVPLPTQAAQAPVPARADSAPTPLLTAAEREALERAISPDFLLDEGWREGTSGEILNERGRRLFEAGFTKAIRKILEKNG